MTDELLKKILLQHIKNEKENEFVIYGTSMLADIYYDFLSDKFGEQSIAFFIDGKREVGTHKGKQVYTINELSAVNINITDYKFVLATLSKIPLFISNLNKIGVGLDHIVEPIVTFSADYLSQNITKIDRVVFYPAYKNLDNMYEMINYINTSIKFDEDNNQVVFLSDTEAPNTELPMGFKIEKTSKFSELINDQVLVMVWDSKYIFDEQLTGIENLFCCDGTIIFHLIERMILAISGKFWDKHIVEDLSKKNYERMINQYSHYKYCVVCGMGTSIHEASVSYKELIKNGLTIVCNNFYRVKIDINPDVYVAQDNDYLTISNSELEKMIQYILKNKIYFCVNKSWIPIILSKYPEIKNWIIGLEPLDEEICFPHISRLAYKNYANVIPAMGIPIASGLKDIIYITGCDGGGAKGKWVHADKFVTGKSAMGIYGTPLVKFNDGEKFTEYEKAVNGMYKQLLSYGEMQEKKYISLTHSNFEEIELRNIDNNGM